MTDIEKVKIFEHHLSELPWEYGHQDYGIERLEPTIFNRVFRWKSLWKWLSVHARKETQIELLIRIACEMGYDYRPNVEVSDGEP